ncbi:uncharacterized protein LOC113235361 [Hyposmocoma kahamanoa]|uniref:uncharacterized protein LOC113235361 n=1 Tax=Hyposmocoma kahamanoa TaxID=1477025 RepID=UPI000E6D7528|nr:uncharacterized protein LOC113235361 [Hyposmocoma kahamanoa]
MKLPSSSEYLSKEILEKDFIKVFSTFHMIQKIMGVSRIDARDRFVTAPSIPQKIYTIIYLAMLLFIIILCIRKELVFGLLALVITYGNFMLEIAYGSNLIVYFYLRVRFINASIDNHIQAQPINVYTTPNSDLKFLASQSCNFKTSDTDVYLKRIFECFLKYQDLYRFQVFNLFAGFIVFWGLSAQIVIDGIQTNVLGLLEWLVISTMCLIAYSMLIFLCVRLQVLYMDIKETKRLCVCVMSIYFDGPIREKAKKMYKFIQENASRFSVYDMWYVDASIILRILGLMTSLLVTLLQFAYL